MFALQRERCTNLSFTVTFYVRIFSRNSRSASKLKGAVTQSDHKLEVVLYMSYRWPVCRA